MDPTAGPALIRRLVAQLQDANREDEHPSPDAVADAASDLTDAIDGLDGWLTRGGALPGDWAKGRITVEDPGCGMEDTLAQLIGERLLADTYAALESVCTGAAFAIATAEAMDGGDDHVLAPLRDGAEHSLVRLEGGSHAPRPR